MPRSAKSLYHSSAHRPPQAAGGVKARLNMAHWLVKNDMNASLLRVGRLRFQDDLDRAVLLLLKDVVSVRSLVEGQGVGGEGVNAQRVVVGE